MRIDWGRWLLAIVYTKLMIIFLHVLIALTSIGIATATFFKPSAKKLTVSYSFIVATVVSGSLLLVMSTSHLLESCLMGLFYITVISIATVAAHVKLRKLAEVHES